MQTEEMKRQIEDQAKRDLMPKKSRRQKRAEQAITKDLDTMYARLCNRFRKELKYKIVDECVEFDYMTQDLIILLDNYWRVTVNRYKNAFNHDDFVKVLRTFTDTCEETMNLLQDRTYVPVVCRMLEETYGIGKDEWPPADKIAQYRTQGLSANDACVRIVLHSKSIINPLKS